MPNQQEVIDRMEELANGVRVDDSASPLIDSEVTAQTLFPHLVKYVVMKRVGSGKGIEDLMAEYTLDVDASGEADLPDSVLKECLKYSYMSSPGRFNSLAAYPDYTRYRYDNQICYYSIKGSKFFYSCVNLLTASGKWTFLTNPAEGETININGVVFTFRLPGMVVTLCGEVALRGLYTRRGVSGGFDYYNKFGQPDSLDNYSIFNDGFQPWVFRNSIGQDAYYGNNSVITPNLVTTWNLGGSGSNPVPTVAIRTFSNVEVEIGTTKEITAANFAAALEASVNGAITVADYAVSGAVVTGTYGVHGVIGNTFTMANSSAGAVTVSGSTFAGGNDVIFNAPSVPDLPITITDELDMSKSLIEDVIIAGAATLRGEIPLPEIIEGYMPARSN